MLVKTPACVQYANKGALSAGTWGELIVVLGVLVLVGWPELSPNPCQAAPVVLQREKRLHQMSDFQEKWQLGGGSGTPRHPHKPLEHKSFPPLTGFSEMIFFIIIIVIIIMIIISALVMTRAHPAEGMFSQKRASAIAVPTARRVYDTSTTWDVCVSL